MKKLLAICLALVMWCGVSFATNVGDAVEVRLLSDSGRFLPFYSSLNRSDLKKVYTEAVKGDHYKIVVHNKLGRRIGVVVVVDGRNIISGQKSWLKSTERMYILEPYATNEYSGWRTGQDKINRFYFTDVPDSYAAAFGDHSAMGIIAVAVFPEVSRDEPCPSVLREKNELGSAKDRAAAPSVQSKASQSAATGYGREEYSPSYKVSFDPENRAAESILIKYEWRSTLCKKKIINCSFRRSDSGNRIWDHEGYAPPPPCRF
jgi:hypothetical protein